MDKRAHIAILFDFYGVLLTAKQQEALRLFYEEDFSLAEIGEFLHISRQAVHDLIKRGEALLEKYESQLALADKYYQRLQQEADLQRLAKQLEKAPTVQLWQQFWQSWQVMKDGD
ncbi:MAG: putative DNA-binding protein [Bacillota bacterium]|jgi:predicted DNA-binding protein YlxM (UPF0122 family)